jgi:hypothetical protein
MAIALRDFMDYVRAQYSATADPHGDLAPQVDLAADPVAGVPDEAVAIEALARAPAPTYQDSDLDAGSPDRIAGQPDQPDEPADEPPRLQEITITPDDATIGGGAQRQFTATGLYDDCSSLDLTDAVAWSSSEPGVVSIDASGFASARPVSGTARLTATDISSGISAAVDLTVGAPTAVNDVLAEAIGAPTRVQDLRASVKLAGGQILYKDSDIYVSTNEATTMAIRVSDSELTVTFDPFLALSACIANICAEGIVLLEKLTFNYRDQKVSGSWQAPPEVEWWPGGVGKILSETLNSSLLSALPKQMLAPGYNPFEDQELPRQLPGILAKLASSTSAGGGSGGGGSEGSMNPDIQSSDAELVAKIYLKGDLRQDQISISAGTSFTLTVYLDGGMPASLADAKVRQVVLNADRGGAEVKYHEFGVVTVQRAVLSYGGSITTEYELVTEKIEEGFRLGITTLRALLGQQTDESDLKASKHTGPRAAIEKFVHTQVEPQLKNLIITHKDVIPGLDLAKALGL